MVKLPQTNVCGLLTGLAPFIHSLRCVAGWEVAQTCTREGGGLTEWARGASYVEEELPTAEVCGLFTKMAAFIYSLRGVAGWQVAHACIGSVLGRGGATKRVGEEFGACKGTQGGGGCM
jgi:hypothetical protein